MSPGDLTLHPSAGAGRFGSGAREGNRAFRAADQLAAILAAGDLPPAVRALGEQVQARLASPVRIAVIGRPGSGKARIVNGLLGGQVLPPITGLPPSEITLGPETEAEVVDGVGRSHRIGRKALLRIDPFALAFLRLCAPLPLLEKVTLLVVPLEGEADEVEAALGWAFARSDMVLWCCPTLSSPDAALWSSLPEDLQDHAFLAVSDPPASRPAEAERMHAACYFREARNLSPSPGAEDRIAGLRSALLAHVSTARREDLEGALIFLDQHLSRPSRAALRAPSRPRSRTLARPDPMLEQVAAAAERMREKEGALEAALMPGRTSGAQTEPAEAVISLLARKAEDLAALTEQSAPGCGEPTHRRMLDLCADALDQGGRLAEGANPALEDLMAEAGDLMLLLQLEASASAVSDGVALLLQVRRECEMQLAA